MRTPLLILALGTLAACSADDAATSSSSGSATTTATASSSASVGTGGAGGAGGAVTASATASSTASSSASSSSAGVGGAGGSGGAGGAGGAGGGTAGGGLVQNGVLEIGFYVENDCDVVATPASITVPTGTEFTVNWVHLGNSASNADVAKIDQFNHVPIVIGMEPGTSYHDTIRKWCGNLFTGTFSFRLTGCFDPTYIDVDCGG